MKVFYQKHRSFFMYSVFGFLGSLVNIFVYWLGNFLGLHYLIANTLAWLAGVLFSFFTNKSWVFQSKYSDLRGFLREFISFVISRIVSLFVDDLIMFVGITLIGLPSMLAKIIDQLIVGLLNYGTSVLVFNHQSQRMRAALRRSRAQLKKPRQRNR